MTTSRASIKVSEKKAEEFRGQMLGWYDKHRRTIPWRAEKGEKSNPYYVWLSEIMCQQTTVQAVVPYFLKFIEKWPSVHDLAAAEKEDVMKAWAGLGYYARARNLHKCANVVADEYDGNFPKDQEELKKLPGIGEYTSAAISTMAFNKTATVVDGNVERVMARYLDIRTPLPKGKPLLKQAAAEFFKEAHERPGDFAQSLMDLGAMICTPKSPKCMVCPVLNGCKARAAGVAEILPAKEPKKKKPKKHGAVYWIENDKNEILLQTRPDTEMMGGMLGLPTTNWALKSNKEEIKKPDFLKGDLTNTKNQVRHSFTHFDLTLDILKGELAHNHELEEGYFWHPKKSLNANEFPTLFKKAVVLYC